jgi:hypothetical protein
LRADKSCSSSSSDSSSSSGSGCGSDFDRDESKVSTPNKRNLRKAFYAQREQSNYWKRLAKKAREDKKKARKKKKAFIGLLSARRLQDQEDRVIGLCSSARVTESLLFLC